jgi:hypothetical protein
MATLKFAMTTLATGLGACGVRDLPLTSGEGGAAGETTQGAGAPSEGGTVGSGGAGGAAGSAGGGGEAGLPACGPGPWWGDLLTIGACLSSRTAPVEGSIDRLTVIEKVPGDPAACANNALVAYPSSPEDVTETWTAWELWDEEVGQSLIAQFAIGTVPDDLLLPGEVVSLRYGWGGGLDGRSYLSLERFESPGKPAIFLVYGGIVPSVTIERGPAACQIEGWGCPLAMTRVTVNGETKDLGLEERAEVGGMVIQNDWYRQNCDIDAMNPLWIVGGYAAGDQ